MPRLIHTVINETAVILKLSCSQTIFNCLWLFRLGWVPGGVATCARVDNTQSHLYSFWAGMDAEDLLVQCFCSRGGKTMTQEIGNACSCSTEIVSRALHFSPKPLTLFLSWCYGGFLAGQWPLSGHHWATCSLSWDSPLCPSCPSQFMCRDSQAYPSLCELIKPHTEFSSLYY